MDNLQKKFIEEASDNINDLEDALLSLEKSPDNKQLIERIFRSLHTLKGTGAMFGFNNISELTHDLENIYDLIREGNNEIDKRTLDITLQCVDHLRNLLTDTNFSNADNIELQEILIKKIKDLVNASSDKNTGVDSKVNNLQNLQDNNTYYISFQPDESLLKNGSNPLFLIDEITSLGKTIIYPHIQKIPELKNIKPDLCYIHYEIIISTDQGLNALTDVFIFVEDECTLEIEKLTDFDTFDNEGITKKLIELKLEEQPHYHDSIQKILKPIRSHKTKTDGSTTNLKNGNLISSIRVASSKLDSLMNLVSELVTTQARLSLYAENDGKSELIAISENVQKLSRQLRDIAFEIVLIPIETVINKYQRLVRDLSGELSKKVNFITEGTDTELDKTIIESLSDPLLHIIRNCIDHGIESPAERKKKGKQETGTIIFKAYYSGTNVVIEIKDDGAGIDPEKIKAKAIKTGLIYDDSVLDKSGLFDLIFMPGFSTASKVTDVSGRGVGMDVVRRKIAEIRGEVKIDSEINKGTKLTILLPLTLSIIDGLLVKISNTHFIIPLAAIDKIYAIQHEEINKSFNNHIKLDSMLLPYFYLREEFHVNEETPESEQVILVQYQDKQVGIIVDHVVGEYQAVLKPLGKHYKNQEMISGASILGDGTVALVLDTNKLINSISNQNINMEEIKNE
ncbi:chemotaxis protein CheA [Bacteroidota bacterium]